MATVNFSVPDDVKALFDKTFGDQNKSAIIAELMRNAVCEAALGRRREQLFKQLSQGKAHRRLTTDAQLRRMRDASR